jgi:hypothetical protein
LEVCVEVTGGVLVVVGLVVGGWTGAPVDVGCGAAGWAEAGREVGAEFGAPDSGCVDVVPDLPLDVWPVPGAAGRLGAPAFEPGAPEAADDGAAGPLAEVPLEVPVVVAVVDPAPLDGSDPDVADFAELEMTVVRMKVVARPTCAVRQVSVDNLRSCESRRASRWPDEVMAVSTAARMLRPR